MMLKTLYNQMRNTVDYAIIFAQFSTAMNILTGYPRSFARVLTTLRKNDVVNGSYSRRYTGDIHLSTASYSSSFLYI